MQDMQGMQGMILIDDKRYIHTKDYLKSKGHVFRDISASFIKNPCNNLDFIIFPFKGDIDREFYNTSFFLSLKQGVIIFSGIRNSYLTQKCKSLGILYKVMMEEPQIATKNAIPTSEGVISYLITSRNQTISGSTMLIIGYGICGSDLASRLKALGANTHTLVRNKEKEQAAIQKGIKPIYEKDILNHNYDAIINTVEGTVLKDDIIPKLKNALLIDIASSPYGFNMALAKTINKNSALLPAIPGKYAIKTSGEILGQYIQQVLRGKQNG